MIKPILPRTRLARTTVSRNDVLNIIFKHPPILDAIAQGAVCGAG